HIGTCAVKISIKADDDIHELLEMFRAAQEKRISAVFVFSINHLSESMHDACEIIDKLNSLGVLVYDNEGYQYSYDWYCKQTGRKFKGGSK
ncbi:MAG: recombinase family protein, partial [Eubacteriales bacterium]|nr:recombinase family protein [Eubacteriales bacterium]